MGRRKLHDTKQYDKYKGSPKNDAVTHNNDPYENLANAIIISAAEDYVKTLEQLQLNPGSEHAVAKKRSIERFFHSQWYSTLTSVDPDVLVAGLQAKVKG